ncbi:DUF484 family protein [Oceanicella actignis]|uniref:DUF484 domain-containing protein n=1 Tax=Oceanicella actignis TaxID=1189325 RepID=A0A1M7SVA7_9RHOB|nr:DUF484 family protein [Oceanicella actignis]SES72470.1 hypothetical protein SAMN04488119_101288 [Oceanicella actignis]SHN62409.1 hypothetical protein SAMN05216200_103289 [Oceanicella actignis]
MTDAADSPPAAAPRDPELAARVRALLTADPGLVLDDMEVMRALVAAQGAAAGRNVVDLRGALVQRLESRLAALEALHRSVLSAAYENLAGAAQIHRAALAMLEAPDLTEALTTLEARVPAMLGVEAIRLGLEAAGPARAAAPAVAPLPPGGVEAYMNLGREDAHRRVVLRRFPAGLRGAGALFGPAASGLGSEALVRLDLGPEAPPALLAFGARDPGRFTPDQGGDLLDFFGGVLERLLRRWAG